jgi:hypothetical protein
VRRRFRSELFGIGIEVASGATLLRPTERSRRGWRYPLCRHEPLLSTRSNKWGEAAIFKASRCEPKFARSCTVLSQAMAPWVSALGSRGNPAHVEHRRQRQTDNNASGQKYNAGSLQEFEQRAIKNAALETCVRFPSAGRARAWFRPAHATAANACRRRSAPIDRDCEFSTTH